MLNASRILALILIAASGGISARAEEATAFELAKKGNQFVGERSKDKIIQIRSEKSSGNLTPQIWHVVYFDPDTAFKAVEVKFVAGSKVNVSRPARVLESINHENKPLPPEALKVDSDRVLAIIRKVPALEEFKLTASKWTLEPLAFDDPDPVWRVELWAMRDREPGEENPLGKIVVSARNGDILQSDLQLDRLRGLAGSPTRERLSPFGPADLP